MLRIIHATSDLPRERSYGCKLIRRDGIGNVSLMKLQLHDVDDELNSLIVQEVIKNTLTKLNF